MTADSGGAARPRMLAFLPKFLFETDRSKLLYIARALPLTLVPSLALAWMVAASMPRAEGPPLATQGAPAWWRIVVAAPLLETLIMGVVLVGLARLLGTGPAVLASAIGWAVAHSLLAPIWGLVVWWPFLVFSAAFLAWRQKSFLIAVAMVTSIHALQNGTALLMLSLARPD